MAPTGRPVFLPEFNPKRCNLFDTDCRSGVAPGTEHIAQGGGQFLICQVTHARHYAVVFLAVYGDGP